MRANPNTLSVWSLRRTTGTSSSKVDTVASGNVYFVDTSYGSTLTQFLTERVAAEVGTDRERVDYPEITALCDESSGSCASVEVGSSADVVRVKLGKPNEIRSDERVRGPGAVTWLYSDSRCAVHMIESKVEFVD